MLPNQSIQFRPGKKISNSITKSFCHRLLFSVLMRVANFLIENSDLIFLNLLLLFLFIRLENIQLIFKTC